jgi:hypothetical protein
MPASSIDCLFGDADGVLSSVFLDSAAPTLSEASLHHLAITSGLVEISQAKVTYDHWGTKTQCESDPTLHYWKSPGDLPPVYLSSQVKALHRTTLTLMKPRNDVLRSAPVDCILVVTRLSNHVNALAPGLPVITMVAAPSMANIGLQSKDNNPGILYEDLWEPSVLEPFESFLNPEEPHCLVLAASEGFSRSIASPTPQLYLKDAGPIFSPLGNSAVEPLTRTKPGVHTAVSSSRKAALLRLV